MKTCGTCFRYIESWRDAEAKGLRPFPAIMPGEYHRKPRPGVKAHAIGVDCPDDETIHPDHPACSDYLPRWRWNLNAWWHWRVIAGAKEFWRRFIRVPIGQLRSPVPLCWQDYYSVARCEIIRDGEPLCPHCGEMPHSTEQCVFCGQRFLKEEWNCER